MPQTPQTIQPQTTQTTQTQTTQKKMATDSTDHRQAAQKRLTDLATIVRALAANEDSSRLLDEIAALDRAISAFHLEGIRFRMYNVDRLVTHSSVMLPQDATAAVADVHAHLEAAGFHTRSHQAPT
jgi:hypothetical protein